MKRKHRILIMLTVTLLMVCMCSVPTFAVPESKVQTQLNAQGKEAVTRNGGGLGGKAYTSSVSKGGDFANSVIGRVATSNISSTGSMTGKGTEDAPMSYM